MAKILCVLYDAPPDGYPTSYARDDIPIIDQPGRSDGAREILESWLTGTPIRDEYLIVDGGRLAGAGAHSYSTRV